MSPRIRQPKVRQLGVRSQPRRGCRDAGPPSRDRYTTYGVGAAGGLGGFFPPLVMGAVYSATDSYAWGFVLLALTAATALVYTVLAVGRKHSPGGDQDGYPRTRSGVRDTPDHRDSFGRVAHN